MAATGAHVDSLAFKTDRPWPNARLKVAAIVGHTTQDSARLWVRTGRPDDFSLLWFAHDGALEASGGEAALGAVPLGLDEAAARLPGLRRADFAI